MRGLANGRKKIVKRSGARICNLNLAEPVNEITQRILFLLSGRVETQFEAKVVSKS